jgi:AraC-like DNA-binding protein
MQLSSLALGMPRGKSARFERSRDLLSDSCDDLVLVMGTPGRTAVTQKGRTTELAPSEMYLLEMNSIGSSTLTDCNRFATVRMPRRALLSLCPRAEDCLSKPLLENRPLRGVIARYSALSAEAAIGLDPVAQRLAAQHLIDLVTLLLGTTQDETELATQRGYSAARLRLIEEDIVAHIADDDLTIGSAARRQGLSPKTLQRMFELAGKTFSGFVLEQRLTRARRLLALPGNRGRKIAELAFDAGFGDLSYFNRAFRKSFGMTPSEWRDPPRHSTLA